MLEYLIIGAGPAGLQFGYYLEQSKRDYLILEKSKIAGSFFEKYPRHRTLISINKVYTGHSDPEINYRWDWNSLLCDDPDFRLSNYSEKYFPNADYLVDYLNDFTKKFDINVAYNSEVANINKKDGIFYVTTAQGKTYQAKKVIVGTGIYKPSVPDIKGIELCENYTECSVNVEDFKNKRVLIIGKGNSGFETADHLVEVASLIHIASPNSIKFAWDTHFVGHLRAINNNLLDTYQLKAQNAIIDANISKIEKDGDSLAVEFYYAHADGEIETRKYDKVLVATGFMFDDVIFDENLKPELDIDDRFPKQTAEWESTNISDLYFVGVLTQQRDYKQTTSAFIHGFRYNAQSLFHILEDKYGHSKLPRTTLDFSSKSFTEKFIERINNASSIWHQFGFLGDVLTVNREDNTAAYFESLPVDYIKSNSQWNSHSYFILTMEFGKKQMSGSTFSINRVKSDDVEKGDQSIFLHPVVRHYVDGKEVGIFHMIESLEADYFNEALHINPLLNFVETELNNLSQTNPKASMKV